MASPQVNQVASRSGLAVLAAAVMVMVFLWVVARLALVAFG
jgi:hypothetical protein